VLPAALAFLIYLLLSYAIVPLWQRYRGRYSRYIPLDTISTHTTSLRQRFQDTLTRFLLPSAWRSTLAGRFTVSAEDGSDQGFDDEDGEELFEVDDNRREALSLDARRGHDGEGRLSRELEEGFRDDSDDETNADQAERPVQ
jgi:hypothetical protein